MAVFPRAETAPQISTGGQQASHVQEVLVQPVPGVRDGRQLQRQSPACDRSTQINIREQADIQMVIGQRESLADTPDQRSNGIGPRQARERMLLATVVEREAQNVPEEIQLAGTNMA